MVKEEKPEKTSSETKNLNKETSLSVVLEQIDRIIDNLKKFENLPVK